MSIPTSWVRATNSAPPRHGSLSELRSPMLGCVSDLLLDRTRCSVAGTLAVVGEKWSLLVLREAFLGVRRFADFQRILGAPRAVLTDRLATLVDEGILRRVPHPAEGERQRHEDPPTPQGGDPYPPPPPPPGWGGPPPHPRR